MSLPNWLTTVPVWLSFAGSVASLVGLFISIAVLGQTKEIRRSFVLRARLPELSTDLKAISSELVKSLENAVADAQGSDAPILRLRSLLINLIPKVDGSQKKMASDLLKKCGGIHDRLFFWQSETRTILSNEKLWEVYGATQGLLEALNQARKDSKYLSVNRDSLSPADHGAGE